MHLFFMTHSFSHRSCDDSCLPSCQNFTISEQFFPQRQTPNAQEISVPAKNKKTGASTLVGHEAPIVSLLNCHNGSGFIVVPFLIQLLLLFPCLFNLCQPFHLFCCVLQPEVRVGVQGDRNVRMAHQIL